MKKWAPYLVAAGVAFFWFRAHDASVRAIALADLRADSLTRVLAALDSIDRVRAVERSAREARISGLADSLDASRRTIRGLRVRGLEVTAALTGHLDRDSTASDSLRALVNTTLTVLDGQYAACEAALQTCETLAATKDSVIAVLDTTLANIRPALERTIRLWKDAERRGHPGVLARLRMALPWMAGTALVVLVLGR